MRNIFKGEASTSKGQAVSARPWAPALHGNWQNAAPATTCSRAQAGQCGSEQSGGETKLSQAQGPEWTLPLLTRSPVWYLTGPHDFQHGGVTLFWAFTEGPPKALLGGTCEVTAEKKEEVTGLVPHMLFSGRTSKRVYKVLTSSALQNGFCGKSVTHVTSAVKKNS